MSMPALAGAGGGPGDKELRREYAILQKDEERRRQVEQELAEKRRDLAQKDAARQKRLRDKQMRNRLLYDDKRRVREQRTLEQAYRDKRRESKILERSARWEEAETDRVLQQVAECAEHDEEMAALLAESKEAAAGTLRAAAGTRASKAVRELRAEEVRDRKIALKEQARHEAEVERVDDLKRELAMELEDTSGVPLRALLVHSLKDVPSVADILAAYKMQKARYESLARTKLDLQAKALGIPLFQYVRRLEQQNVVVSLGTAT